MELKALNQLAGAALQSGDMAQARPRSVNWKRPVPAIPR